MGFRDDAEARLHRLRALERENQRLREELAAHTPTEVMTDPRLGPALAALRTLFAALREAMRARGEAITSEDVYQYPRSRYDGFYASHDRVRLFLGLHLGASLQHGLSPLVVQLTGQDDELVGSRLADAWEIRSEKKLLGWNEGPFVSVALHPGLEGEAQIEALLADIDRIRAAVKQR